jgi:hypothetical protein
MFLLSSGVQTHENQCPGRFLGIIGQNPSVPGPTGYIFRSFIIKNEIEVYSIGTSEMIGIFLKS